jgi:hypothetical protein
VHFTSIRVRREEVVDQRRIDILVLFLDGYFVHRPTTEDGAGSRGLLRSARCGQHPLRRGDRGEEDSLGKVTAFKVFFELVVLNEIVILDDIWVGRAHREDENRGAKASDASGWVSVEREPTRAKPGVE